MSRLEEELAAALDECLSAIDQGMTVEAALALYPHLRAELAPLVLLALDLQQSAAAAPATPAPAFRRTARARIMAQAEASLQPTGNWLRALPAALALRRWATAVLAVAMCALLSGGLAIASTSATPGEPLYPVKLMLEDLQLAIAADDDTRVELHLAFAERRADEVARLAAAGRAGEAVRAAHGYEQHVERATSYLVGEHPPDEIELAERLAQALERQQTTLAGVRDRVPEPAKDAIEHALDVSKRGKERAIQAHSDKGKQDTPSKSGQRGGDPPNKPSMSPPLPDTPPLRVPTTATPPSGRAPEPQDRSGQRGRQQSQAPGTDHRTESAPESTVARRETPSLEGRGSGPPIHQASQRGEAQAHHPWDRRGGRGEDD